MCNTLSPRISVLIFTESLSSMQFSSSTKFSLKEMFSCHKMGHAILSNMVEINQKTYPKDKKTFKSEYQHPNLLSDLWSSLNEKSWKQKSKSSQQKMPQNHWIQAVKNNWASPLNSCLTGKCFSKEAENMWGGSLLLFYLTGKWFSREVENKFWGSLLLIYLAGKWFSREVEKRGRLLFTLNLNSRVSR